jgi:hypothetical protein
LVECEVLGNNTKGFSSGWEAGGMKVTLSRRFVVEKSSIHDNRGPGIWYDIGNELGEVAGCTIRDNDEAGIFYEISYGLRAHDNLIVNNAMASERLGGAWGAAGVTISSSQGCRIEHNTLVGNRDGVAFREQQRETPRIDSPERAVPIADRDAIVRDNIIAWSHSYSIAFWFDTPFFGPHPSGPDPVGSPMADPRALNLRFENNLIVVEPGAGGYLYGVPWRPRSRRFGTPQAFAAAAGIADSARLGDPGFVDPAAADYRLRPGSLGARIGAGVRPNGIAAFTSRRLRRAPRH